MKCVVTGGAGFIGSNLVQSLVDRGDEVTVFDNFHTGKKDNLSNIPYKELITGDILDSEILDAAFKDKDAIFHLAALRSVPQSMKHPLDYHRVNIDGTRQVLEAARKADVPRVIFASSSSVYGDGHPLPLKEDFIPKPVSPYALTKLAGEHYLRMYHELYGLKTITLRYFNVFGPKQDPKSEYSTVIPLFLLWISEGRPPTIFGDGEQSRDFTYVKNVVEANILASVTRKGFGGSFNIADGVAVTVNDLAKKVNALFGKKVSSDYNPEREGDVLHTLADLQKSKEILDYVPVVGFDEGLLLTKEWFIESPLTTV